MPQIEFSRATFFPKTKIITPPILKRSIFENNAHVYYKPHSLSSGGVGTVRNSRMKGMRT